VRVLRGTEVWLPTFHSAIMHGSKLLLHAVLWHLAGAFAAEKDVTKLQIGVKVVTRVHRGVLLPSPLGLQMHLLRTS